MRKRFGNALRIGLSKTGVTVVLTSGWLQTRNEVLAQLEFALDDTATPDRAAAKLGGLLKHADCAHMPANIVLSDAWVRRWMVTPPQNATSLADCQAAAGVRFQALFGESMNHWQLSADWDARRPFLACAIPVTLLTALQQVARERSLVLREIAPQFVVAWNRWRSGLHAGAWFGVLEQGVLTYAVLGQHGPEAVRELALPDAVLHDQSCVPEFLAREALRQNVPMPHEICLSGQIPVQWVKQKIGTLGFVQLGLQQQANIPPSAGSCQPSGIFLALAGMNT